MQGWATCPTYTIAGMYGLYKQLLPTKLYTKEKTQTSTDGEVLCTCTGWMFLPDTNQVPIQA